MGSIYAMAAALISMWTTISAPSLCVDGHPAHRAAHVTYGGLAPRAGYERDHRWPLCLGGPDDASNVWYQPWPDARVKDKREWTACEAYCAGRMTLDQAKDYVARWREDKR